MVMKFRAHETFFIRKGWLSKGMKYVALQPNVFTDKTNNPMDVLGIGANMVKSLRYWLQATGLTVESKGSGQHLTDLGKIIFEQDRYLEELSTLYLIQYKLATNANLATSWYYFFNHFNLNEFSKEDFLEQLKKYILMLDGDNAKLPSLRSLEDDFTCIINTYLPRYKQSGARIDAENNIDCPLGELGLIDFVTKKSYKKSRLNVKSLHPWIALAIIQDNAGGRQELPLNNFLLEEGNLGKVFNLDAFSLIELLHRVELLGEIKVVRTAGLDVVQFLHKRTFIECVNKYYESLNTDSGSEAK